ncbi:MAG: hypothetical protein NTV86_24070 [Planctomycetota bacterium]|nr:hypothetical protein [Planctomycetota bacterium]
MTAPLFTCQKTLINYSLPLAADLIARSIDKKEDSTHSQPRVNLPFPIFEDLFPQLFRRVSAAADSSPAATIP